MTIKNIILNEENILLLEKLRYDAYGLSNSSDIDFLNTFHANQMKENKYLVYGIYFKGELASGCYVTNSFHSLFIEQLFVKTIYQESGLYFGRKLLQYVLEQKENIQDFYQQQFLYTKLYYGSLKSKLIYQKMGYINSSTELGLLKKSI